MLRLTVLFVGEDHAVGGADDDTGRFLRMGRYQWTGPGQWMGPFRSGGWEVAHVATLDAAIARLAQPEVPPPQVVVLGEPRPGVWNTTEVEQLRRLAPLARFVRYSGSWCEGQARSGRPPAGTAGVYWHRWAPHVARQLEALARGDNPSWVQPLTATPDEQVLCDTPPTPAPPHRGLVVVRAATASTRDALRVACGQAGYLTDAGCEQNARRPRRPRAVLWDTHPEALHDAAAIAELQQSTGGAPVLALVGFPRPCDVQAALAAGIAAVISKPWNVADLQWHLEQLPAAL